VGRIFVRAVVTLATAPALFRPTLKATAQFRVYPASHRYFEHTSLWAYSDNRSSCGIRRSVRWAAGWHSGPGDCGAVVGLPGAAASSALRGAGQVTRFAALQEGGQTYAHREIAPGR